MELQQTEGREVAGREFLVSLLAHCPSGIWEEPWEEPQRRYCSLLPVSPRAEALGSRFTAPCDSDESVELVSRLPAHSCGIPELPLPR